MEANCTECGNPIEYEAEQANTLIDCPHCGAKTGLPRLEKKPIVNLKGKLWFLAAVVGIPLFAVAITAFIKLGIPAISQHLEKIGGVAQFFMLVAAIAVVGLTLCLALAWLLLPLIVWTKLDALIDEQRKQTAILRHPAATRFSNP